MSVTRHSVQAECRDGFLILLILICRIARSHAFVAVRKLRCIGSQSQWVKLQANI